MLDQAVTPSDVSSARRWHDLDALRGFAMLIGIGLHASLAFFPSFWPVQDKGTSTGGPFDEFLIAVHGFRMPLFFLLSGFFTAMLWRRRGTMALVSHRVRRIVLPLALGLVTIVPIVDWASERGIESSTENWAVGAAEKGDIWFPILLGHAAAIPVAVVNGADVDVRGEDQGTPLHLAAFMDLSEVTRALLDAGADHRLKNVHGSTPLEVAVWVGSPAVADVLVGGGAADIRTDSEQWQDIDWFGDGAEFAQVVLDPPAVDDETGLDSWIDQFHHLWFLWFLCWLVAGFALAAPLVARLGHGITSASVRRRLLWIAFPLTFLFQFQMGDGGDFRAFGPDTSTGLLPAAHVLFYYAVFFGYGAATFDARTDDGEPLIDRLGQHWKVVLPVSVVLVFPLAAGVTFEGGEWAAAASLQVLYTWGMTFGLIGLFRRLFSCERYWVRYLSDASYWMYLAHLPLVILAQDWMRGWDIPRIPKFLAICWAVSGLLLLTYHYLVRYTPVGTLLNGLRTRPEPPENLSLGSSST
ncbi:MAG: acyltransferase family protein [Acidimicrobiales bacterium]|jgi:peptidoglycan/LPS O-acetylase OafA/YrhL|nr:acyltransferase family protein [Acidimicrobiales bacterium]